MWHKAVGMGHPMKLELTCEGLLIYLANYYTTRGTLFFFESSAIAEICHLMLSPKFADATYRSFARVEFWHCSITIGVHAGHLSAQTTHQMRSLRSTWMAIRTNGSRWFILSFAHATDYIYKLADCSQGWPEGSLVNS